MQFAKIKEHLAHLASVTVRPTVACQTLNANRWHLRLLRARRERPRRSRAAEKRDELAPVAVGTRVTSRPPHRSVRAAFPHTAPPLGIDGDYTLPYASQHR